MSILKIYIIALAIIGAVAGLIYGIYKLLEFQTLKFIEYIYG